MATGYLAGKGTDILTEEEFKKKADIEETEAVIGTNIALHQEIYGKNGTTYRYKLKTDCPHWKYEDRYECAYPLPYVREHAAVETKATRITVRMDGAVLAEGQYFSVPVLGLTSDDKTLEEAKSSLMGTAYAQYEQEQKEQAQKKTYLIWIVGFSGICLIWILLSGSKVLKDKKIEEDTKPLLPHYIFTEKNNKLQLEAIFWKENDVLRYLGNHGLVGDEKIHWLKELYGQEEIYYLSIYTLAESGQKERIGAGEQIKGKDCERYMDVVREVAKEVKI